MNLSERYSNKLAVVKNTRFNSFDNVLVQLEVTNACNHRCVFCPNKHHNRTAKMIDYKLAEKVITECADFLGSNKNICFHMNGEPLLYNRIVELIDLSKRKGYDYIFLTTNGSLATPNLLSKIFEAGLDSIKFSINAGTEKTYKKVHGADDFEKAFAALKFAAEWKKKWNKKLKIFVSCVGIKDNYDELELLKESVSRYCDEVVFYYPCTYAGQESVENIYCDLSDLDINTFTIKHTVPCSVLWNSINVTAEGYLAICCSEADNRLIVENLNEMSVKEAWLGKKMQKLREKHILAQVDDTPCSSCVYGKPYNINKINMEIFELSLSCINGKKNKR
ncbi:radical SAM/SPASM domain-containing protein [Selenomonas sp. FC4001]|uniref:radical SAM/SPASM domain-containing protein n=1 Tax=Selenomonas sp. FC4001 TaxID=1408313 RepID=UPI00068A6D55|nr:radical SAM/SPASM domain-containing protein [Selenomonas sp. FC4001]